MFRRDAGDISLLNFLLTRYSLDVEKRLRFVNLNVTDGAEAVFLQILDEAAATNWKTKEKANIRKVNKLTALFL